MKLSKLPSRTRRRIWKLASNHLLDVEQVIGIAIDVLWAALEGGVSVALPKPPSPAVRKQEGPEAVGDLVNAAIGQTRRHNSR